MLQLHVGHHSFTLCLDVAQFTCTPTGISCWNALCRGSVVEMHFQLWSASYCFEQFLIFRWSFSYQLVTCTSCHQRVPVIIGLLITGLDWNFCVTAAALCTSCHQRVPVITGLLITGLDWNSCVTAAALCTSCHQRVSVITGLIITGLDWNSCVTAAALCTSCHQRVSVFTGLIITRLDWNRKICVSHCGMQCRIVSEVVLILSCLDFLKLEHSRLYIIHESRHLLNLVTLKGSDIVLKCNKRWLKH